MLYQEFQRILIPVLLLAFILGIPIAIACWHSRWGLLVIPAFIMVVVTLITCGVPISAVR
jgi:hypothetical protein